jgi:hypothetical protein
MPYSKLSDDILKKKIAAALKSCDIETTGINTNYENADRQELENICTKCTEIVAAIKKKKQVAEAVEREKLKQQQEEEKAKRRLEQEQMEKHIKETSIVSPELLTRLKFRFFNLAIPDNNDPEGNDPISSGPFFENIEEQFTHELNSHKYKVYAATYNGDDMSDKEEYQQKNLNKCFASRVEEKDMCLYFFTCFRCIVNEGKCSYQSYWVSNYAHDIGDLFSEFDFNEISKDVFVHNFTRCSNNAVINEIYAR